MHPSCFGKRTGVPGRLSFMLIAIVLLGLFAPNQAAAWADEPSWTPIDANRSWHVDPACEYALILWDPSAENITNWTEMSPGERTSLTVSLVELDASVRNCGAEGDGLSGGAVATPVPILVDSDADGSFESTFTKPFNESTFRTPSLAARKAPYAFQAKVTAPNGGAIVAEFRIHVGERGVSINDGASYTNTKAVTLDLSWPGGATEARVSNDGGFASSKTETFSHAEQIAWNLDDSVKGLYTKVVYVRFSGVGVDTTKTYSDDIVLDTNPPTVTSATATASTSALTLTLAANDDITGTAKVQVQGSGGSATADFSSTVTVPMAGLRLATQTARPTLGSWVKTPTAFAGQFRVADAAGNWGSWISIKTVALQKKKQAKTAALLKSVQIAQPKKSKVKLSVGSKAERKICKVLSKNSGVKGLKAGVCRVRVSVTPKTGKSTTAWLTLTVR